MFYSRTHRATSGRQRVKIFCCTWSTAVVHDDEVVACVPRRTTMEWRCGGCDGQRTAGLITETSSVHQVADVRVPTRTTLRHRRTATCGLVDVGGSDPQAVVWRTFDEHGRRAVQALDQRLVHCINIHKSLYRVAQIKNPSKKVRYLYNE